MSFVGWTSALLVLFGVLTAWMDPPSSGPLHASIFALAAVTAAFGIVKRVNIPVHWIVLLPLGCAAWGALQVGLNWSVYPFETWNSVSAWLARAVVFSAAYAGFQNQGVHDRFRSALVWFGGAFSLLALLQWYSGGGTVLWMIQTAYKSEVAGTFGNRDQYAAFMELLLPVALAACLRSKGSPVPAAVCAGLMFASVVASASRAGTIIVCIETIAFIGVAIASRRKNYRAAGLIFASLLVCTLVGGWNVVWQRLFAADPFALRREMLTATVEMIRERPSTGFGLGAWPSVYPAFAVFDPPGIYMNHAHNDWAEWAADGGIPFLIILTVFAWAATGLARRNLWTLGIPAVLLHALVDFPLQKPALACAVFWMAGVAAAQGRQSAKRAMAPAEPDSCGPPRL